jgi:hypothetical protein
VRGVSSSAALAQSSLLAQCAAKLQVPTAAALTGGHEPPRLQGRKEIVNSRVETTVGGTYSWASQMSSLHGSRTTGNVHSRDGSGTI